MGDGAIIILFLLLTALMITFSMHLLLRVRKLERKYQRFMKGKNGVSMEQALLTEFAHLEKLEQDQDALSKEIAALKALEQRNFTKYGVIKYDAFEDVGGKLSFVLALLSEEDTGIVLNAIHSKDNCYLYLKEIVKGESYIMLSEEEVQALQNAKKYDEMDEFDDLMSTAKKSFLKRKKEAAEAKAALSAAADETAAEAAANERSKEEAELKEMQMAVSEGLREMAEEEAAAKEAGETDGTDGLGDLPDDDGDMSYSLSDSGRIEVPAEALEEIMDDGDEDGANEKES